MMLKYRHISPHVHDSLKPTVITRQSLCHKTRSQIKNHLKQLHILKIVLEQIIVTHNIWDVMLLINAEASSEHNAQTSHTYQHQSYMHTYTSMYRSYSCNCIASISLHYEATANWNQQHIGCHAQLAVGGNCPGEFSDRGMPRKVCLGKIGGDFSWEKYGEYLVNCLGWVYGFPCVITSHDVQRL